jgi:hypothetical protein
VCVCVCEVIFIITISKPANNVGRSEWPRGLRRVPVAARLLGLWV